MGKHCIGLFDGCDAVDTKLLVESVLEGAPEAFDSSFGLRRASADPGDAEFVEDASDLGQQRLAGELFFQRRRFLRPGPEDLVTKIIVESGTYPEMVTITSPLSLVGQNATIDASGQDNGFLIQGASAAGTEIDGFTVENATFEGILAMETSHLTIAHNVLRNNDQGAGALIPVGGVRCGRSDPWRLRRGAPSVGGQSFEAHRQ